MIEIFAHYFIHLPLVLGFPKSSQKLHKEVFLMLGFEIDYYTNLVPVNGSEG